ncbi:MAG: 50S ribosomal protein L32 [Candidatus Wildermuthbacteria bacterium]|nr:50S ribosomal protein L32 [Candidatus Wildermuthbacteria bacterium]
MAVPKQHRSKSRQGQRRMHLHAKQPSFVVCSKCKKEVLPHAVCLSCGFYQGREAINVLKKIDKKKKAQ